MNEIAKIQTLKNTIKNITEKEVVSKKSFIMAKANVNTMCINSTSDAFLYYASLNLLNTYVKQNKDSISYAFKDYVKLGFDYVIMNNISDVSFCFDEEEHLTIINVLNVQFSYHNANPSVKMNFVKNNSEKFKNKFYVQQKWEGIRLQMGAETIFNFASNLEGLTNTSIVGNLKDYQLECLNSEKE